MTRSFTLYIVLAMLLGILVGDVLHEKIADAAELERLAGYFSIATEVFLRLIKMIIAPLVLSTLIVGIARMGGAAALGRIGLKTMAWFLLASLLSLVIGLVMVTLLAPGVGLHLPLPSAESAAAVAGSSLNLRDFVTHLVPKSIVEAMSNNEILQVVVFALPFGAACASLGERVRPLVAALEALVEVMLKVTGYVMRAAPAAIFAAVATTVMTRGLGILLTYGKFLGGFYLTLGVLWAVLGTLGFLVVGRPLLRLLGAIREPVLLAFSTATSEAAYPRTLAALEGFGIPNRIASFVLPLGYSFNLDGSMAYCTFAMLFIAQAYGIEIGFAQKVTMLLMLMVTSKGMAGVPRASFVVIAAALPHFRIPDAGLLLILAVDQFLDMGRSATNVVGNSIATAVVARWENALPRDGQPAVVSGGQPAVVSGGQPAVVSGG